MAGNSNSGRREQPFLTALQMELAEAGKDHKKLRSIARQLIEKADSGDMQAIIEFANRIDGKPRQQLEVGGDPDNPLHHVIERRIIDPSSSQ